MKNAWIIGGSHGIGLEVARRLVSDGWRVTVSARNQQRLEELSQAEGFSVLVMDATESSQVSETAERVFSDSRGMVPELVLINVGDYEPMSIDNLDARVFARLNRINYLAPMYVLEKILPLMRDAGGGDIWVNASLAAYRGLPKSAPYSASKAATLNMVECLSPEAENWGIHLGVINHGFVKTRLTDKNTFHMPSIVEPQQAANYIVDGMRKKRFEITFPWLFTSWMKVMRCLPYAVYFLLTRQMVKADA